MNSTIKNVLLSVVFIASVVLMFVLRIVPVSKIWSQYSVLYVSTAYPEDEILSTLYANGCTDVISLSGQKIPFVSAMTPVQFTSSQYLSDRALYFTDESESYTLFYIPSRQEKALSSALSELIDQKNIQAGVDGSLQFPFIVPVVCAAVFVILTLLSKNRLVFATLSIAPVLVTLCVPFYPCAAAVILLLASFYLAERLWHRKGSMVAVFSCPYIDILAASSVAIMSILSFKALLIFVLSLIASAALLMLLNALLSFVESRHAFTFVPIFSASQIPLMVKRRALTVALTAVPIALLLVSFLLSANFFPQTSVQSLSIPTPLSSDQSDEGDSLLPDMSDYFAWAWNTITFPYKNLNVALYDEKPYEGEEILIPRYTESSDGVKKTYETVFTFDGSFRNELIDGILDEPVPQVEKLLLSEGENVKVAYRTKAEAKTRPDAVSLILMLSAMVLPLLLYLYYYLFGRQKNENGS